MFFDTIFKLLAIFSIIMIYMYIPLSACEGNGNLRFSRTEMVLACLSHFIFFLFIFYDAGWLFLTTLLMSLLNVVALMLINKLPWYKYVNSLVEANRDLLNQTFNK